MIRPRLRLNRLEDRLAPAAGLLDPTFGAGGLVTTRFPNLSSDYGRASVIDHQGRILVAGYVYNAEDYDFAVARYSSSGALDTSFGGGAGTVTAHLGFGNSNDQALDVAIDSQDRVVVAGYASNGSNYDFAVVRLTSAGTLDAGFGSGGKQLIDFGGSTDKAATVAIDSLDRVVVAGTKSAPGIGDFAVTRLTAAGVLDSSFGAGGKFTIDFNGSNDVAYCVAIDSLGRIVVSGYARVGTTNDFAAARLTSAGGLDSSFGTGGKATFDFAGGDDVAAGVAMDSLGRVVLGGWARIGSNNVFAAARLNTTGGLDSSFGAGGRFTFAFGASNDQAWSVAVDSLDRVVLAGYSSNGSDDDFAAARLTTAGALDPSFDSDGRQTILFGTSTDQAYGVTVDSQNRVVVSGYATVANTYDFAVARLTSAGALDPTFDGDGKQTTEFMASSTGRGSAVASDHLGRTVVAGIAYNSVSSTRDFTITRYTSAGVLDASFGGTGVVYVNFVGDDYAYGVAVDSMNRVLVVGNAGYDFGVARLTAGGALDASFGVGGKVTIAFGTFDDIASAVAVDSSDRPVIAGFTNDGTGSNDDFAVARLTTAGALDTTFNGTGKQVIVFGPSYDDASGVAIDSLGRVVIAGDSQINGGYNFAIARLSNDGELDASFGAGGKVLLSGAPYANAMALDSQNRVVVVGEGGLGSTFDFAVVRLTTTGTPDPGFNGSGWQYVAFGDSDDRANAVAIDAHDRVVVAGLTFGANADFGIARLTVDGALDGTFGAGGKTTVAFGPSIDVPYGVAIDAAGRPVVAGWTSLHGDQFAVARLTGDTTTAIAQVNDGSAQRSRVTSLTITFSSQVAFAGAVSAAFTLTRIGGGAVSFTATANLIGGHTVVTLNGFTGAETNFGSLADGRYTLIALASQISADSQPLDGDANGVAGGDFTFGDPQGLFRFFGDINGDRRVDIADFGLFSLSYLNAANYVAGFDFNGDGRIDIADFGRFSLRYLAQLP